MGYSNMTAFCLAVLHYFKHSSVFWFHCWIPYRMMKMITSSKKVLNFINLGLLGPHCRYGSDDTT